VFALPSGLSPWASVHEFFNHMPYVTSELQILIKLTSMLSLIFIAFYIEVYGGFLLLILDKENFFRGKKIQDKLIVSVNPHHMFI
jgi:hypothetical protein